MGHLIHYVGNLVRDKTKAEDGFKNILMELGIPFQFQYPIFSKAGKYFIVDFLIPEDNIVVEIDGHYHKKQRGKDQFREDHLRHLGYKVIRFTNEEVLKSTLKVEEIMKKSTTHFRKEKEFDRTPVVSSPQ